MNTSMTSEQYRLQRNNSDKRQASMKKKEEITEEKKAFSKVKKMTDIERQNTEFG